MRISTKRRTPYTHDDLQTPYWRSPSFWSRVLGKNLLALADTQLLTGIAIQFTAMLRHCKLSIYHFQIVIELAFLTTVTHLLTVVVLRNYFVKNRWINLPRVFLMLGNLGVLGYTSFVAYSYDLAGNEYTSRLDSSASLACFFQRERPGLGAAFGGKWAALLIGAIGGHATIIAAMYLLPEENLGKGEWSWKWLGAMFRNWIIAPGYAIYGVVSAGQILTKTQALGTPNVKINGNEDEWGFGQFLPVLLLGLPIFAGWESFWGELLALSFHFPRVVSCPELDDADLVGTEEYDRAHISQVLHLNPNLKVSTLKIGVPDDTAGEERMVQSSGPSSTLVLTPLPGITTTSPITVADVEAAVGSSSPRGGTGSPASPNPQVKRRTTGTP